MLTVSPLLAISGMLAAGPAARPGSEPAAVEISFATIAGEGAVGRRRFVRDGCYQVESGGSTGGAGYARDSQAGCLLPAHVAAVFTRLGAVADSALVREQASPPKGGAAGGARAGGLMPGGAETHVVLIRGDGSRWVAANKPAADDILRAVNELPSENQWYAKPPDKPVGPGAQLFVVSYTNAPSFRAQASLAADGRWWCYQSVIGTEGAEPKLPAKPPKPLKDAEAAARLGRILKGMRPDATDDAAAARDKSADDSDTAEVAWPGQPRTPLRPRRSITTAMSRFAGEMQAMAPSCAHRPVK
jgi:hypothetical protein